MKKLVLSNNVKLDNILTLTWLTKYSSFNGLLGFFVFLWNIMVFIKISIYESHESWKNLVCQIRQYFNTNLIDQILIIAGLRNTNGDIIIKSQ